MSQETFQNPDGQKAVSKPQVPLIPRARHISEGSTVSVKEDEEESSDEEDKKSSQNTAQREKSSGFGWFSWFRSKPTNNTSPSADEDSDSTDPEENPRPPSPPRASPGLSRTSLPEPPSLPGASTFSTGTAGGQVWGSASGGGTAEGTGSGASSGLEGVSSESYFSPGALLPPTPLKGSVPLYNPSQVPQLSMATSLNRPNRLAQRRYPTQP